MRREGKGRGRKVEFLHLLLSNLTTAVDTKSAGTSQEQVQSTKRLRMCLHITMQEL